MELFTPLYTTSQRMKNQTPKKNQVFDYIYHLNAQTPSGEAAFKTLAAPYGFAKDPVIKKMDKLDTAVPITFLYGAKSWISSDAGKERR